MSHKYVDIIKLMLLKVLIKNVKLKKLKILDLMKFYKYINLSD